jgi:hypothetical protein
MKHIKNRQLRKKIAEIEKEMNYQLPRPDFDEYYKKSYKIHAALMGFSFLALIILTILLIILENAGKI